MNHSVNFNTTMLSPTKTTSYSYTNSSNTIPNYPLYSQIYKLQCKVSTVEYPLFNPYYYSFIAMITFDTILSPITIILNLLILSVMYKNPCLRTIPNCVIMNLAISDLLAGFISQPCKAIQTTLMLRRAADCSLYTTGLVLGYIFGMVSCLTLALMAIERYLAIFQPFKYIKMTVNTTWLVIGISFIWLLSISIGGLSLLIADLKIMRIAAIAFIILTITCSSVVYTRAILVVQRINRRVSTLPAEETTFGSIKRRVGSRSSALAYNRRKLKATEMAVLVLVVTIACYSPSCVLTTLRNLVGSDSQVINGVHDWGQSLVLLNSALNPVIYCWRLTEMRKKTVSLVRNAVMCRS